MSPRPCNMKAAVQTLLFIRFDDAFQRAHTQYTESVHYVLPFCSRPVLTHISYRGNTHCPLLDSSISSFTNDEGQTSKKKKKEDGGM